MRDVKTEQFLTNGGWEWTYVENILFAEIDLDLSKTNPSRMYRSVNEEVVTDYMMAMSTGDQFPALTLLTLDPEEHPLFKYMIATGVHRTEAALMNDRTGFDAYIVVEADLYRRDLLCRQINTIEGFGVTRRDKIKQIIYLNEKHPERTLKQLATEWNVPYSSVKAAHVEEGAMRRARKFGFEFSPKNKVNQKHLIALNAIKLDPVFSKALSFVQNHNTPPTEIDHMVSEIRKVRDEAGMLGVIERYVEDAATVQVKNQAKYGRSTMVQASKFMAAGKTLNKILEAGIEALHMDHYPRRDHAMILAEELIESLRRLVNEIGRIERINRSGAGTDARPAVH